MIFATVGSTYFDELIREIDRLAAEGFFAEEVVCQIGSGSYVPLSCPHFRFSTMFDDYLSNCSMLITHGGMTVLEAMWRGKALIAVANTGIRGNHQVQFLQKLAAISGLVWTDNPASLRSLVPAAKAGSTQFRGPHIAKYIRCLAADEEAL